VRELRSLYDATPEDRRRLVSFDLDGTLVDLQPVYVLAHQAAAMDVLGQRLEKSRVLELMRTGLPIRRHMGLLDESLAGALVDAFVAHYRIARDGLVRPFPGITELLARLHQSDVAVAVVTSKLRPDAVAELEATGLQGHVDVLVAFEDTDEHKPSAAPQLEAMRLVGATDGLGVGDLPTDIASFRAAGFPAIAVTWGYGVPEALVEAGADCVCTDAAELEHEVMTRLSQESR
jgi:phosphoglycolate phosphatase-like HAD superfamily hydrolase